MEIGLEFERRRRGGEGANQGVGGATDDENNSGAINKPVMMMDACVGAAT